MHISFGGVISLVLIIIWVRSEIILAKSIKSSERDDSIWLILNIIVPVVGCVIYRLTHKTAE